MYFPSLLAFFCARAQWLSGFMVETCWCILGDKYYGKHNHFSLFNMLSYCCTFERKWLWGKGTTFLCGSTLLPVLCHDKFQYCSIIIFINCQVSLHTNTKLLIMICANIWVFQSIIKVWFKIVYLVCKSFWQVLLKVV